MPKVTYDSMKADQAWLAVASHLHRRNQMLADGVRFLEHHPVDTGLASRLIVLQYHLRATVRRLVNETASFKPSPNYEQQVRRQWQVVHQLNFLLRQIDEELHKSAAQSHTFGRWMDRRQQVLSYKATTKMHLN